MSPLEIAEAPREREISSALIVVKRKHKSEDFFRLVTTLLHFPKKNALVAITMENRIFVRGKVGEI